MNRDQKGQGRRGREAAEVEKWGADPLLCTQVAHRGRRG